jgi:hypothetical protein
MTVLGIPRASPKRVREAALGPGLGGGFSVAQRARFFRDQTQLEIAMPALGENGDKEVSLLLEREAELTAALVLELPLTALRGHGPHEAERVVGRERREVEGPEDAAEDDARRLFNRKSQFAGFLVDDELKQLSQFDGHES